MTPYRVLFINDTARNGGPGRSLHTILKFLDPRVIHRTVVLPRPGAVSELLSAGGAVDELRFEPNIVENVVAPSGRAMRREDFAAPLGLQASRALGNAGRLVLGLSRLRKLVHEGRYQLIYCNGTTADFLGGTLARTTGVPALWHVRYTSIPSLLAPLHRQLSAGAAVPRIICVSQAAAQLFAHCHDKVRVIHNAVDVAHFADGATGGRLRAELGLGGDAVIFGSHGRVLRRKGYVEMVQAAERLQALLPAEERQRCHFVVIGDTPDDFRVDHVGECRQLVAQLGLSHCFHFLGFRADVRALVADFDVAVVPSIYPDPLPRSVLESMALGKPVIAFALGGIVEMVAPGRSGTLVPGAPPDVDGLAAAMRDYLRDPRRRADEGAAGRARIEREFNGPSHGRAIQAQIVQIIDAHAGRRHAA
jgi:glycosyltransferase involved in cell wall biosynthesis